jgi:glycosyltransferase involved in cell wall biosynthesis
VSEKKHILIFIDWFYPAYKAGGPVQSCLNLIERLSGEFRFSVITGNMEYPGNEELMQVPCDCWTKTDRGHRVIYLSKRNQNTHFLQQIISAESFDFAYLNGLYSANFTRLPLKLIPHKKIILAARGMLAPSALRVKPIKKWLFLLYAKTSGLFKEVTFHATHAGEVADINKWFPENHVIKAGNLPANPNNQNRKERTFSSPCKLLSIARIAPEKNLLFAIRILQDVSAPMEFNIYGPIYAAEYWQECLSAIEQLPSHVKVNYHGPLSPLHIHEVMLQNHLLFMPTRGENFGHIIMESWQHGLPVLISDQTPWKNLQEQNIGKEIPLNTPKTFVNYLDSFGEMNLQAYREMEKSCLQFAEHYLTSSGVIEENMLLFSSSHGH